MRSVENALAKVSFFSSLSQKNLRKLPRGALSAGESSWDEGRKIPERMISSALFHFKKNRNPRDGS